MDHIQDTFLTCHVLMFHKKLDKTGDTMDIQPKLHQHFRKFPMKTGLSQSKRRFLLHVKTAFTDDPSTK